MSRPPFSFDRPTLSSTSAHKMTDNEQQRQQNNDTGGGGNGGAGGEPEYIKLRVVGQDAHEVSENSIESQSV